MITEQEVYNKFPDHFIDSNGEPIVAGHLYKALGATCIASFDDEVLVMTTTTGSCMMWHYTDCAEDCKKISPYDTPQPVMSDEEYATAVRLRDEVIELEASIKNSQN